MATATKGKKKRVGAVIVDGLAQFAKQLEQVPKLSPDERLALAAECENQWHWCKDRKYRATIKGMVDTGLMRFAKHPNGDNVTGWEVTGLGRAVAAGLRRKRPEAKIPGSTPGSRSVGRERAEPDTSTYEGRFAARLGALVKKRGIDPRDLAKTLGVNQAAVYAWLAGRKTPAVEKFPAIAAALGVKKPGDILPLE